MPEIHHPLEALEPKLLWQHFDTIRRIPRPSKHEEKIIECIKKWAADGGYEVLQDATGSMTIKVPATPGHEDAPTVILQGHVDMVCEKNSDVEHDFMTQGIEVEVVGDWVQAKGTTLGADNGIALALALTLVEESAVVHPPLELLFTVDEESGLLGAKNLDPELIDGHILLNIDSEEEGVFTIGCAGGGDSTMTLPLSRMDAPVGTKPFTLKVSGLRGGVDDGRGGFTAVPSFNYSCSRDWIGLYGCHRRRQRPD
mgnify:CR=1 FL=1